MTEKIKTMYFGTGNRIWQCLFNHRTQNQADVRSGRMSCMQLCNLAACYLILTLQTLSRVKGKIKLTRELKIKNENKSEMFVTLYKTMPERERFFTVCSKWRPQRSPHKRHLRNTDGSILANNPGVVCTTSKAVVFSAVIGRGGGSSLIPRNLSDALLSAYDLTCSPG